MLIQEIIEKIQKNDPDLKKLKLSRADNITDEEWKELFKALLANHVIEEIDFSERDLNNSEIVVEILSRNTAIKTVVFSPAKLPTPEQLNILEDITTFTFDIKFGYRVYRQIDAITARNKQLKQLETTQSPQNFSLQRTSINENTLSEIVKNLDKINSLDLSGCTIESDLLKQLLTALSTNESVKEISLKEIVIPDDALEQIFSMADKKITISEHHIDDTGKEKIIGLIKNNSTKNLVASGYKIDSCIKTTKTRNERLANSQATELDLSDLSLDERDMPFLADYLQTNTQLKTLKLNKNALNAAALSSIAQIIKDHPALEQLEIGNNPLTNASIPHLVEITKNPHLKFLSLSNAQLTDISAFTLALEENTTLSILELSGNAFGNAGAVALSNMLENNKKIARIKLRNNDISDAAVSRIILREETKVVDISGNQLSVDQLDQIVNAFGATVQTKIVHLFAKNELEQTNGGYDDNQSLREEKCKLNNKLNAIKKRNGLLSEKHNKRKLDLKNSYITVNHIDAIIDCLKNNPQINELNLSGNNLGDDAVIKLIGGIQKENLNIFDLNLANNQISSEGARVIGDFLKNHANLVNLDLSANTIEDKGATDIAAALSINNKLRSIDVSKNGITTTGMISFAQNLVKNRSLSTLHLEQETTEEKDVTAFMDTINPNTKGKKQTPRNSSLTSVLIGRAQLPNTHGSYSSRPFTKKTTDLIDAFTTKNKVNKTSLFTALSTGNIADFQKAFNLNVSPYAFNDTDENTPLHIATERGYTEIVKYLLSQGIADIPNKQGKTALNIATEKANAELIALLSQSRQIPSAPALEATPPPVRLKNRKRPASSLRTTPNNASVANVEKEEGENAVALPPPTKRIRSMLTNEDEAMDVEENLFSVLYALENKPETEADVLKVYRLVKNGAALQQDDEYALLLAVQNGWYRMMKIILTSPNCDANTISTALAWAKHQHNQDMIDYLELAQRQKKRVGPHWIPSLNITFGGRGNKTFVVEGDHLHADLALQNTFTQQRLALPLKTQLEEELKDPEGNPVTASLKFIVSNGRHYKDRPNQRTTFTIPLNFTSEFHVTHASTENDEYKQRIVKRMQLGNGEIIDLEDAMYARTFHHGEQALMEYLEQNATTQTIIGKLLEEPFMHGAKIYGVVLDIATPRYPCNNCQIAMRGEQHPESTFLENLKSGLVRAGCKVPQFSDLRMITRVGSYQAFESAPMTPEDHQQTEVDMRIGGNHVILLKDLAAIPSNYTQFMSRQ